MFYTMFIIGNKRNVNRLRAINEARLRFGENYSLKKSASLAKIKKIYIALTTV